MVIKNLEKLFKSQTKGRFSFTSSSFIAFLLSSSMLMGVEINGVISSSQTFNDGDVLTGGVTSGVIKGFNVGIEANSETTSDIDATINGNVSLNITNYENNSIYGIKNDILYPEFKPIKLLGDGKLIITGTTDSNIGSSSSLYGIFSRNQKSTTFSVNPSIEINLRAESALNDLVGIYNWSSHSSYEKDVRTSISTDNNTVRLYAVNALDGNLTFNSNFYGEVTSTATKVGGWGYASVVNSNSKGNVVFNGEASLKISGNTSGNYIFGANAVLGDSSSKLTTLAFNGDTTIEATNNSGVAVGLYAQEYSKINVKNNISITATGVDSENSFSLYNDSNSVINISKVENSSLEKDAVVGKINGNISTSSTSSTNINLISEDSFVKGSISQDETSSTSLALHSKATWENLGASSVTNLFMNDGVITQNNNIKNTLNIENYSGSGTINFSVNVDELTKTLNNESGKVSITNASPDSVLNITGYNSGINTLDSSTLEDSMNILASNVHFGENSSDLTGNILLGEGFITPKASATLEFDSTGKGIATNITQDTKTTTTMTAIENIAAASIISWRQEDSDFSHRLGQTRLNSDENGIWSRYANGKFKYNSNFENKYNLIQLGYDKLYKNWRLGLGFSYNSGSIDYIFGDGENTSFSILGYGTWIGKNNDYLDIILKQGKINTEYNNYSEVGYTHGDYSSWGSTFSAEYGKKYELASNYFITPMAKFSYMRIESEDYTTNNNIHISQETLESFVGKIALKGEKIINTNNSIFIEGGFYNEFAGDAKTHLKLDNLSNEYSQEIGDNWGEISFGVSHTFNENGTLSISIDRTFGDKIKTPYEVNLGFSWLF